MRHICQTYIGVKKVEAFPEEHDGKQGYHVIYEDGYESWSPKDVFERAYMPIGAKNKLTQGDIDKFFENGKTSVMTIDKHITVMHHKTPTKFFWTEHSGCVDPANYDIAIGEYECTSKVKDKIWNYLGFVLSWAQNGLK